MQQSIICRFRVLHAIVSDNGPQFISKPFQQFCVEFGIKNIFYTPRYPQSNGQANVMNKTLVTYLKKRLTSTKCKWVDELPIALWAYRTIPRQPTRETPYALTFGAKALTPVESRLDVLRIGYTTELTLALEELEEREIGPPFEWSNTTTEHHTRGTY